MAEETKPCVACAEEIKAKAVLCKHCKTRQDDEAFTSPIDIQEQEPKEKGTVSQVIMIAGGASVVLLLLLWGVLAFAFPSSSEQEDEANQSAQSAVASEPAPVPAGKLTEIGFLEIGDCLNDIRVPRSEPTDSVHVVACSELHDSEVIASTQAVIGSSWEESQVRMEARQFCAEQFVELFKGEQAPSRFIWRAHFSTEDQWAENGFVDYVCVLSAYLERTVGQFDLPGTETPSQTQTRGDSDNGVSDSESVRGESPSSAPNPVDEVEQQRRQLQSEIDEQNAALEAQRRADAIADYESKLDFYASEVATRIVQIEQLYAERDAAYADFQNTFGIPYQRGNNSGCNSVDDFFGCIREHAAMPLFEFSIGQLESDIDFYVGLADSLVAPY